MVSEEFDILYCGLILVVVLEQFKMAIFYGAFID